ncbi:MAG TPA: hydrogenase maturation nickel metallochaperone HypA [Geobacteraceae bacterium]|nr:hydrogenase maturation nickel metallochaperone HypA [Geobacteraceae bacterium]
MHEMSITQSVVDICAQNAEGRRIISVTLEIGALSGVVPEAVEFCFEACTRDTLMDGARLIIERIPAMARCLDCGAEGSVSAYYDACPACGGYRMELLTGQELRVKELEVE